MIPNYNHDLITSFGLWLDNRLLTLGEAYVNISGALYLQKESSVRGNCYVSPYRSWVYDSCATGAIIASGAYTSSGQFLTASSGIVIDYINGRIITPHNWGPTLTAAYSRKEVNVYFSSSDEVDYVLEQVDNENQNLTYPLTGFEGNALAAPMIMLTNARETNDPFSLGGIEDSRNTFRAFLITNKNYLQEGISRLCTDSNDRTIPFCSYADAPIGSSGNLKGVNYNYCTGIYDYYGCTNGVYIDKVYSARMPSKQNKNVTFYITSIEFDLSKIRQPR